MSKLDIPGIISIYGNRLKGFIRKRIDNKSDVDDVLQDVYFRLAESDQLMKPIDQIAGWLFSVTRNLIIDFYKKKRPIPLSDQLYENDEEDVSLQLKELFLSTEDSAETEYLKSMVWTELEKALCELPLEQREVFEMHELDGYSFEEISQKTGVTVNTLMSRKRYAVLHLRSKLQELYYELLNY
jgi:RNA polymerase sigma factor (sigma-70 family)